jgi:serine/threonine protein kinase
VAERQFGPYRLVRQIAVGGMAEIHLAKTKGIAGFEKYVALKMIHPNFAEDEQFIQMLVDEAKIAVQLTHGNIAQTFDLGRVGETYYITMEFVDGADLYKILRRGSEQDLEMPLDVCAFIGKEIASALDHAHRKKDHVGRPLGIVHRDVSPQNVLVSFAGEVKLVDFGIAKATMKARQTAVGVIKGKYYYMSPEQAWGDIIDYRSDIFSAGIVLYEMITGQMLYLEEDLHKLLDMARKADIAPPSRLRKGVPPQLEKIVMHALQKVPGERYQNAGDFATDLERFLHTYSPVFTAGKISALIKQVIGDPMQIPNNDPGFPSIEIRDGINSTHTIDDSELAHAEDKEDLRTENSVIFRIDELKPTTNPAAAKPAAMHAPKPAVRPAPKPVVNPANRKPEPPRRQELPLPANAIPSISGSKPPSKPPLDKRPQKPRHAHEETRQLPHSAPPSGDESGLLEPATGRKLSVAQWDSTDTDGTGEDLENIGERTMITAPPSHGGGFMMDVAGEDGIDATMITGAPTPDHDTADEATDDDPGDSIEDEEGPTMARDMAQLTAKPAVRTPASKVQPPALAAKIHAPAVSSLRTPKASRRTPGQGVPVSNVLQQIVGSQVSEPMPVPRPDFQAPHGSQPPQPPPQFPSATPGGQPAMGYATDASGMPLGVPTPPGMAPLANPNVPAHLQPYMHAQGVPPQYMQQQQPQLTPQQQQYMQQMAQAQQPQYPQYPQMSPGSLYQMGYPPPQPMTLTGQMRLYEVDEIPSQYKIGAAKKRWFTYIVAGIIAISVAAIATFLVIRMTREGAEVTSGSIIVESLPTGADVLYDGTKVGVTPITIDEVPLVRHEIKVVLPRHAVYEEDVDIPKATGQTKVMAILKQINGRIVVDSKPDKADILIDGVPKGQTPKTIVDLDMASAKTVEIRLKGYQPHIQELKWPQDGKIDINVSLKK